MSTIPPSVYHWWRMQKAYKTDIKFMIGDMAYDSNDIYETLKEENDIISVVPYNPRNGKKIYDYGIQRLYFLDTSLLKQKYKRRTSVERVNNIVTKELGLDDLQYKGLKGVTFQAYIMHYSISSSFCCSVIGSPKTDATCFSLQVTFFTWNNTFTRYCPSVSSLTERFICNNFSQDHQSGTVVTVTSHNKRH